MVESLLHISHIFGAESTGGIGALGVDLKALILQILTFVLVFWLLKKFALGKIIDTLEKRRETIDAGVKLGQQMTAERAKLQDEIEKAMAEARAEADKIIAAGHQNAGELLKEAEAKAAAKLNGMLADAHSRIDEDMKRARKDLEKEMLGLIAEATEAVIGEKLDLHKDTKLIEKGLQEAKNA